MVELIAYTPNPEEVLMKATAKCYKAEPSIAAVRGCIKRGHTSVLEHVAYTFDIDDISRSLLAQFTRHRVGVSPTVQSQRYVKEEDFDYIIPPSVLSDVVATLEFQGLMLVIQDTYNKLVGMGIPKEDARYVLPNACITTGVWTMNLRALMHFWKLRLDKHAQWEIRELARQLYDIVTPTIPNLADIINAKVMSGEDFE